MKAVYEIDWDDGNRDKCRKHGLSLADVEHVLRDGEAMIVPDPAHSWAEQRSIVIGRTAAGRRAFVVVTVREVDGRSKLRQISARPMHAKEIERYERAASEDRK